LIQYCGFKIKKVVTKPKTKRAFWRIYDGAGNFKATFVRLKDAKRRIDFCLNKNLWNA